MSFFLTSSFFQVETFEQMKQLIEFIPIALFGGVYFWTRDIFIATMVLMGGIVLQLAVEYWTTKKVSRQTQIIFWSAILLGGATLLFRNEEFLFWKPTIVNWIFSVTLLGFHFFNLASDFVASIHAGNHSLFRISLV